MEIKYVVMPITIEQKKEYNRQGFRVIDARFAPEDAEIETHADGEDAAPRARRNRRGKSEE